MLLLLEVRTKGTQGHTILSFILDEVASEHAMRTCGGLEEQLQSFLSGLWPDLSDQLEATTTLPPGKGFPVNIQREAGWAAEEVWPLGEEKNLISLPQIKP